MGILSTLFGGDVSEPIEAVGGVLDNLFTSDDERLSHEEVKERLRQQPHLAQVALNKVEAQHRSIFVAGWRPFIGWVAGLSLAIYFIPQYLMGAYIWVKTCLAILEKIDLASADILTLLPPYPVTADGLMELTLGLLGLGLMRTAEKMTGRAK